MMAMFKTDPVRPAEYRAFERPLPEWFRGSALGIFVHWGPYSVPAWAEPTGELGARPVAAGLQQREQREHAIGGGHGPMMLQVADRS